MIQEKLCANCHQNFSLTDEDFAFYQKIKTTPPSLCPDCRLQRRLAWRNEQVLHKRTCDLCKKPIISIYRPDALSPVYCSACWWSDTWNPFSYGQEFDFTKTFFEQFYTLMKKVPRPALICEKSENCSYSHNTTFSKNCYLCFSCFHGEDCYYNYMIKDCKDAVDNENLLNCELCYECINCRGCYNGNFLEDCENCSDSSFCYDCKSLKNCFGCVNLQHKEYYIFNKPVAKEEYQLFMKKIASRKNSKENLNAVRQEFETFKASQPQRACKNIGAENSTGNHIFFSKNAQESFNVENCEDIKHCIYTNNLKDSMDVYGALMGGELQYETSAAGASHNVKFAYMSWHNSDSDYLNYCNSSNNLFGCIGLRHAKFSILNRQYSREEYEKILPHIAEHMQQTKEIGEFFPIQNSPYPYTDTKAQELFPLSEE